MKKRRQRARLKVVDEGDAYEMTTRMLRLATSLRRAAEILDQADDAAAEGRNQEEDFSAVFYGAPLLRAQSAEIALKALWRIGHNQKRRKPPHDHNLTKLHDGLTEGIQKLLAEEFPRYEIHHAHTSQYRSAKDSGESSTNMKPPSKSGVTPTNSAVSSLSTCSTRC